MVRSRQHKGKAVWPSDWSYERLLLSFSQRWEKLKSFAVPIEYQKGQVVFYAGHGPFGVFIFNQGQGAFEKADKKVEEMELQKPIGLNCLHENQPYPTTLKISEFAKGIFISKNDLLNVLSV